MCSPRLSIASTNSYGDSSEDSGSLPSPSVVVPPTVTVGNIVVNPGGMGVLRGNLNNYTVNTYIVQGDEWDPKAVNDLVTDAVKISSDNSKKFFPLDVTSTTKLNGNKQDLEGLQKRWCYLIAALVSLSFFTLLTTAVFSLTSFRSLGSQTSRDLSYKPSGEEVAIENMAGAPRIVPRIDWLAEPPAGPLDNNSLPIQTVVVCHTASDSCLSTPDCITKVRLIQRFHVESRHWNDIGYNFLIGGDGDVYWGRGFDTMGAHTKGHNYGTIGVAFIGTFDQYKMPNETQIVAFHKLIDVGVKLHKISANYSLVAQCQLQPTAAPGQALVTNMTSWPHFDSSLPSMCT